MSSLLGQPLDWPSPQPGSGRGARPELPRQRPQGPLSARDFAALLEQEKRRSDRSHEPLSMLLFRLEASAARDPAAAFGLLELLDRTRRDTDVAGCLQPGLFALLCPSTGEAVSQRFARVMSESGVAAAFSSSIATYPTQRFAQFEAQVQQGVEAPDPFDSRACAYPQKRLLDITGALLGILLLWPLMGGVWILVRATSPGPGIFRQQRLGQRGVPFTFYKFRSMTNGASDALHRDFAITFISHPESATVYKLPVDTRVTPLGRWLRRTSIDEIPQLFNVLKGEMSLVGPRPPIPYEAANYQPWHLRRVLEMKPGITGIWQVEGRSQVSFDDMVRMDIQYQKHCSLGYDLRILLKTMAVVWRCEGAY